MFSCHAITAVLLCTLLSHIVQGHTLADRNDLFEDGLTTQEESELNEIALPDPTDQADSPAEGDEDTGGDANEDMSDEGTSSPVVDEAGAVSSDGTTLPGPIGDEEEVGDDETTPDPGASIESGEIESSETLTTPGYDMDFDDDDDDDVDDDDDDDDSDDDGDSGEIVPTDEPASQEEGEHGSSDASNEEENVTEAPVESGETEADPESTSEGSDEGDDEGQNTFERDVADLMKRRIKRNSETQTLLSNKNHPMLVVLHEEKEDHHRVKRTSFNVSKSTWPHHIPYIIEEGFPEDLRHQLKSVLDFLMSRLCIEFTEEANYDPYNANWFKEHGYSTNAFIRFYKRSTCAALFGRGSKDQGPRKVSPCTQFFVMMHEVVHSLGGIHSQNFPYRERYITVHQENIEKKGRHNYRKNKPDSAEVEYEEFDSSSMLMYATGYFSKSGLNAFDYIRPEMGQLYGPNTFDNIFMEINKNYRCQETECANEDRDCGPGYLGFVNRKCGCVCPAGFDPAKRCKELINAPDTSIQWPDTSFALYKGKECPAGLDTGMLEIPLAKSPLMKGVKLAYTKKSLKLGMCSKTTSSKSNFDSWPIGTYCINKAKDVPCEAPFKEGAFILDMKKSAMPEGPVGDITVDGKQVTIKYCCRKEGDIRFPMRLPTDQAFRLNSNTFWCQAVEGMWGINGIVWLRTKSKHTGSGPQGAASKNPRRGMRQFSCYYQPPTYGCSKEVMLDDNNPSVSIKVPMSKGREPNRRCFYFFQAPEGSKLRLTFNKISLDKNDMVLVKRFNLLTNPHKLDLSNPPHQLVTERHQLLIEYWAYMKASSKYGGLEFTVDLLPADEFCYDGESGGADYAGPKDVAETYDACVPWDKATQCPDFPWEGTNGLHLLNSGKSCRNLDTVGMLQPWCYGYVNGRMCTRRYCDVCNQVDPVDKLDGCKKFIADDPNFCTDSLARFGCFNSCGMDVQNYDKSQVKCSRPVIPDGLSAGDLQDSYDVGSTVSVTCSGSETQIECTTLGWTPFDDACAASQCMDSSQLCENAIAKFSGFCTNELSMESAQKYCKKSCGQCDAGSCTVPSGGSYSAVGVGDSVSTGKEVQFACNDGLRHVSGDLQRACSSSGELVGDEPQCDAKAPPADVNLEQVYYRKRNIPKTYAYLMLGEGLDVPFDGKITKWFYYCSSDSKITLLVYRKTGNSKTFELVGSNDAPCVAGWPWSHNVPAAKQIDVQKGDILGVYDPTGSVVISPCGTAPEKTTPIAATKSKKISSIIGKSKFTFSSSNCAYISISARVEPN